MMVGGVLCILLELEIRAATFISREVWSQTYTGLRTLPKGLPRILAAKAIGSLPSLLPIVVICFTGFVLAGEVDEIFDALTDDDFWTFVIVVMLFYHLVTYISLYVRHGAGAIAFIAMMVMVFLLSAVNLDDQEVYVTISIVGCLALIGLIARRMTVLAAR